MASGDITTAPIGTTIPLAYGPVRATGKKLIDFTASDSTIIQAYGLAEGEWDGGDVIFVNNVLAGLVSKTATNTFTVAAGSSTGSLQIPGGSGAAYLHFHSGSDTPVESPFVGSSVGTDFSGILHVSNQLLDQMWSLIPTVVNPLFFSRLAYYFISYKPASTGTTPSLSVIGDWRTTKCRIFDADGNQTDYKYTDNPAWHLADSWLRRVVKPEYAILPIVGADHLSSTERACFDWESYLEAANYFDEILANGKKRFRGAYAFASSTTLAAIHEQILLCCRSYQQEYAGKLSLMCDKPRASTFVLNSKHLVPGSITIDSQEIHANPNRFIGQFLDLELPVISTIASIEASISGTATVVDILTTQPNPAAKGDLIAVAGVTDSSFDAYYSVTNVGTAGIITAQFLGATPPTGSSTAGSIGYPQTRFSTRAPELNHQQAQKTGALLISSSAENATRLNKKKVQYDFANCTYDQQNRLLKYESLRSLGADQSAWNPPVTVTLTAWSESVDSTMRALKAQLPGDVITLDDTIFFEFAGDYEIIERDPSFFNWQQSPDGTPAADQNAGTILLKLRTFNQNAFPDVSDAPSASFAVLPGNELADDFTIAFANYEIGYTSLTATDTGTDITLSIAGLVARINGATLTYADTNITALPYGTYGYLFVNDPTFVGGTKSLSWSTNEQAGNIAPGLLFITNLTTPPAPASSGGSGGSGGGGGTGGSGGGPGSGGGSGTGAGGGGGGGRQLPP